MSSNIVVIYSAGLEAVAEAFGASAAHLAANVRLLPLVDDSTGARRGRPDLHVLEWADGIAFGTPIGDGDPAPALMTFLESTEPLWSSGRLHEKAVTVFTDEPERIAPDSVLHPVYDALYQWGAVIVGPRALDLKLDAQTGHAVPEGPQSLPGARLRAAQYRAARLARLAGVLADERHRRERMGL